MRVLEVGFVGVRVPKVFAPQGLGYSFFGSWLPCRDCIRWLRFYGEFLKTILT